MLGDRRSTPHLYYKQAQLNFRNLMHTRMGTRTNSTCDKVRVVVVVLLMVGVAIGFVVNFASMFEKAPETVGLKETKGAKVHVEARKDWSLMSHLDRHDVGATDHGPVDTSSHLSPGDAVGLLRKTRGDGGAGLDSGDGITIREGSAPITAAEMMALERQASEGIPENVERPFQTAPSQRQKVATALPDAQTEAVFQRARARDEALAREHPEAHSRRTRIKQAFVHAYNGYEKVAMGHDEVRPVSEQVNDSWGGFGITLVDALDTMLLMGLEEQFHRALLHVESISWEKDYDASFFETSIRLLGGLLGAFNLSFEPVLLNKAAELGERLVQAFDAPGGLPWSVVNLKTGEGHNPAWTQKLNVLSEVGSVQLEFTALSVFTGKPKFFRAADAVMRSIATYSAPESVPEGLFPVLLDGENANFPRSQVSFGGLGDSFYEYLLKMSIMIGEDRSSPAAFYWQLYSDALDAMKQHLVLRVQDYTFVSQFEGGRATFSTDHLTCFVPGMVFLGSNGDPETLAMAAELVKTCYKLYEEQDTGLGPESVAFDRTGKDSAAYRVVSAKYLLRPEVIESLFYAYRFTHDEEYREMGWKIFEAIENHCKTDVAYSGLDSVITGEKNDSMQSFFLAETLKYLYLLFSPDDELDLANVVFTTEAHPLPVMEGRS